MKIHRRFNRSKEAGMVAIMVTLILMIVISLLVLGFAQLSRRNQRQALDRQLSTQAFYAAETGVNDAAELIDAAVSGGTVIPKKPDCASTGGGFYSSLSSVLDATKKVEYTCVLVDPSPMTLSYSDIATNSTVMPLIATSGNINDITITWQSKDSTSTPADNCPTSKTNNFSPTSPPTSWPCGYGVLRFDLVPTAGSALSLSGLQSNMMTTFVMPLRPGSSGADTSPIDYAPGGTRNLVGIVCSNTSCSLNIRNLTQSQYYLRVSSLYKAVSLQVSAAAGGTAVSLQGAQAVVDVTGKAQDVLRRIQVRIPLIASSSNQQSDYAIQSNDALCKRFSVMDGYFLNDANNAVPGVAGSTTNPFCQ